jgi:hypothetical protein
MIEEALNDPDPKTALRAALERISKMGEQNDYHQGFIHFLRFMEETRKHAQGAMPMADPLLSPFLDDLAFKEEGGPGEEDRLLDLVRGLPEWRKLQEEISESEWEDRAEILLIERNGAPFARVSLDKPRQAIARVKPGTYDFKLDTGRHLWSGAITEKDLLWSYAFPEKDLPLAADTGEAEPVSTKELRLLEDHMIVRVFPGMESGRLAVHIHRTKKRRSL